MTDTAYPLRLDLYLPVHSFSGREYLKKNIKVYAGLGLLILVVLFTLQNTETVPISFLFWEFRISRALMILMIFVVGVLVGISSNYLKRR